MICPKCATEMEQVVYEEVEVDRCPACKGIWLDAGEREALTTPEAVAAIDSGDASSGNAVRAVDRFPCPRCKGGMVRMVDPRQSHVWFEKCSTCGGAFFDASELRDLSEVTVLDFFKSAFTPERK